MTEYIEHLDPSAWIKNTTFFVEEKHRNRIAMGFYADGAESKKVIVQSYDLNLGPHVITEEVSNALVNLIHNMILSTLEEYPSVEKVAMLVVHEELSTAYQVMDVIIDVPVLAGIYTATAIMSDDKVWLDRIFGRYGNVDMETITTFEVERILEEPIIETFIPKITPPE